MPSRSLALVIGTVLLCTACTGMAPAPPGSSTPGGNPTSSSEPQPTQSAATATTDGPPTSTPSSGTSSVTPPAGAVARDIATGLRVPWSIGLLPDGSALITERDTAAVLRVGADGTVTRLGTVPGVERSAGEGGLLGLAVPPDFAADPVVYIYFTTAKDNRIALLPIRAGSLGEPEVILSGIPQSPRHDGGRLVFGPDGYLYVGTGDAAKPELAQDRTSLAGKILRITVDGSPAPGNPVAGSPVWSSGHRNVEGLAFDLQGRLWASEFGQDAWDELNLIERGGNYGWPQVEGKGGSDRFIDPALQWRPVDASPSGLALGPDGALYLAALRGESLWRIPISDEGVDRPERLVRGTYGRLRDVVAGPDGTVWLLTDNRSRGVLRDGDDRLVSLPVG
jgi:glucose/arabinose dehydrogenase